MSLQEQFQIFIFSFLFGIIFLATYNLFNRLTYKIKGTILRLFLELTFFSLLSLIFFFTLLQLNNAILSIYIPLALILGIAFYLKFLSFHTLLFYEYLIKYLKRKLRPIKVYLLKKLKWLKDKFKIRGRKNEKNKPRRRKKEKNTDKFDTSTSNNN